MYMLSCEIDKFWGEYSISHVQIGKQESSSAVLASHQCVLVSEIWTWHQIYM